MRIARLAALTVSLLALSATCLFASGFENTGIGTTAKGMGGAFRAIANDWSAAYYNPAGYGFILDNQIGGSVGFTHHRDEITAYYAATDPFGNDYGWGIPIGQTLYNFHGVNDTKTLGFVARLPLWGEMVIGLSTYRPLDYDTRWRTWALDASGMIAYNDEAVLGNTELPGHDYLLDLNVTAYQFTASRLFNEETISVGIGIQLLQAKLWYGDLTFRDNPRGDDHPDVDDRPRDRIPEFTNNDGDGLGLGLRAGALWKINDKLSAGITGFLPFDITVTGTTGFTFVLPKSERLQNEVDAQSADFLFVSGDIIQLTSDFEATLKIPASFGVGLAYQATDKLTVALDAEYVFWSAFEGFDFTYTGFEGYDAQETEFFRKDLSSPVEWEDAAKIALGLSYDISPNLTLLAGGSSDQSPARNSSEFKPQFMDLGTKYTFTGGGVLHINEWDIGLVTSYTDYPDLSFRGLTDINSDGAFDNFPGDYKAETFETVFSIGYRF